MQKIISLFRRDFGGNRNLVLQEVTPGAEWVLSGEGRATRKLDGTACMIRGGKLYKRYDCKQGKPPPANFEPAQEPDEITGHHPGWLPVGDGPEDQFHRAVSVSGLPDGTYELLGPKIQGNPEKVAERALFRHGDITIPDAPRTFAELKTWFATRCIEGIVWHHSDGRMVKIKRRDFGLPWPVENPEPMGTN